MYRFTISYNGTYCYRSSIIDLFESIITDRINAFCKKSLDWIQPIRDNSKKYNVEKFVYLAFFLRTKIKRINFVKISLAYEHVFPIIELLS